MGGRRLSVLLDTQALLWWLMADPRLSARARDTIDNPDITRFVSSITAFEIATKVRIGKLEEAREISDRFESILIQGAFTKLDLTPNHALLAGRMPGEHRDPFDRLIAAQAKLEDMPVISSDKAFLSFGVHLLW